jgi:uncharacterized protein YpmS
MASNQPIENREELEGELFENMQKNYDKRYRRDFVIIISLLALFFIIIMFFVFSFRNATFDFKNISFFSAKQSFDINSLFDSKTKEVAVGESFNLQISDSQLEEILKLDSADFPIKKSSIKITPEKIILSGRNGSSLFSLKVDVGLLPKVKGDKIALEIISIESLGVVAPKQITDAIRPALEKAFADIYSVPANINIKEIKLNTGTFVIVGETK